MFVGWSVEDLNVFFYWCVCVVDGVSGGLIGLFNGIYVFMKKEVSRGFECCFIGCMCC